MDTEKWKSVVIPIAAYNVLTDLAKKEHRTISGKFTYLLEQKMATNKEEREVTK